MAAPSILPINGFNFTRNLSLLNGAGSLGINVSSEIKPDVAAALASPTAPFPPRDIDLLEIGLAASTAKPIEFARGADKISFSASLKGFAGLGVYHSGATLLKRLGDGADDFSLGPLEFGDLDKSLLSVLRWGYDASGKVSGAMALGAVGQATLSIAGEKAGLFAVIRRLPSDMGARAVLQETADSWILPRQITSIDQVPPGTWIATEAMGSISVKLGAQVGYTFNWVREARLGGLTGDIGLRLQMGVNAAVGFSSSGRCAIVVSRDTADKALRLRLFRLKSRQFDLSLDAALSVQAQDTLLPDKIDDFIAAVFDTHGQQIVRDLQILDKWTDPATPLSTLLANAGVDGAEKLIANLAGVKPEELQQKFDLVHDRVVGFIDKWHALPHQVSSVVYKLIENKVDLTEVKDVVGKLSTITGDDLKKLLDTQLGGIDFFQTPVGQIIESIAGQGVLSLLNKPLDELHDVAGKILGVLDGSTVEDVLKNFQNYIETELHLDKVLKVATETDFAALDGLLKKKLANFLGQDKIVLPELEKIRKSVNLLLSKRQEYYEKALEALHRKYNFELTATYQSTTTDQALLDATFDFKDGSAAVLNFFQQALQGKLDDLFLAHDARIAINTGKISHGIRRQTQVDVTLPYFKSTQIHLNESLASVQPAAQDGGLLFTLNSSDTVANNQRKSVLSVAMSLTEVRKDASSVRLHDTAIETNYTMLYAKRNMKQKHVRAQLAPAIQTYFPGKIPDLDAFLNFIDLRTEEAIPNGPNVLGNGLISLQVSLSSAAAKTAGQAWLNSPGDFRDSAYQNMSRAIQKSLKQHIHDSIFTEPEAYGNIKPTQVILAYCAIVPAAPPPRLRERPSFLGLARRGGAQENVAPSPDRGQDDQAAGARPGHPDRRFRCPVLQASGRWVDPGRN